MLKTSLLCLFAFGLSTALILSPGQVCHYGLPCFCPQGELASDINGIQVCVETTCKNLKDMSPLIVRDHLCCRARLGPMYFLKPAAFPAAVCSAAQQQLSLGAACTLDVQCDSLLCLGGVCTAPGPRMHAAQYQTCTGCTVNGFFFDGATLTCTDAPVNNSLASAFQCQNASLVSFSSVLVEGQVNSLSPIAISGEFTSAQTQDELDYMFIIQNDINQPFQVSLACKPGSSP